jgi:hypothetical protein
MNRVSILESISYADGRKHFGAYEEFIDTAIEYDEAIYSGGDTELSVIVPVMERHGASLGTIKRIISSLGHSSLAHELIVVDNSLSRGLKDRLWHEADQGRSETLSAVKYLYDARLTFPAARNLAIQYTNRTSEFFASWDSDIHPSVGVFDKLVNNLPDGYIGMAPPLTHVANVVDKEGVRIELETIRSDVQARGRLAMPGAVGEEYGRYHSDMGILQTTLMRGAFVLRRAGVELLQKAHPEGDVFPRDFTVWSNVPSFMLANEAGHRVGYLMDPSCLAFHIDDADDISMGNNMANRIPENLKSLCMLLYRLDVYEEPPANDPHTRFWQANVEAVRRVMGAADRAEAEHIMFRLAGLARILAESEEAGDFSLHARKFVSGPDCLYFQMLVAAISHPDAYQRIKKIKSIRQGTPPYYISEEARRDG